MTELHGLFEIHITVDTTNGYYPLWKYIHNKRDLKLIHATSETGIHPEQYMVSKWKKNGSYDEVLEKTNYIVKDMERNGIKVIRAKIESMALNTGVPNTADEYDIFVSTNDLVGKPYFEYHGKVDLCSNDLDQLTSWCKSMQFKYDDDVYIGLSVNICGSKIPIITIRVYKHGRQYAKRYKNIVLDNLKTQGFKVIKNIQQEFSVHDINDSIDKNWLIY